MDEMLRLSGGRPDEPPQSAPGDAASPSATARALGLPGADALVAGSVEALVRATIVCLVPPGGRVLLARPCPELYTRLVFETGRVYVDVGRRHDLRFDVDALRFALREPDVALVVIDSPGDPSGVCLPSATLVALARGRVPLLVDRRAAADGGLAGGAPGRGAVLELLAAPPGGPRDGGFLAGPCAFVQPIAAAVADKGPRAPSLEGAARGAAVAVRHVAAARRLRAALRALPGLVVAPGAAPFVYVRVLGRTADELAAALAVGGIEVAAFPGAHARDGVRILAPLAERDRRRVVAAVARLVARDDEGGIECRRG